MADIITGTPAPLFAGFVPGVDEDDGPFATSDYNSSDYEYYKPPAVFRSGRRRAPLFYEYKRVVRNNEDYDEEDYMDDYLLKHPALRHLTTSNFTNFDMNMLRLEPKVTFIPWITNIKTLNKKLQRPEFRNVLCQEAYDQKLFGAVPPFPLDNGNNIVDFSDWHLGPFQHKRPTISASSTTSASSSHWWLLTFRHYSGVQHDYKREFLPQGWQFVSSKRYQTMNDLLDALADEDISVKENTVHHYNFVLNHIDEANTMMTWLNLSLLPHILLSQAQLEILEQCGISSQQFYSLAKMMRELATQERITCSAAIARIVQQKKEYLERKRQKKEWGVAQQRTKKAVLLEQADAFYLEDPMTTPLQKEARHVDSIPVPEFLDAKDFPPLTLAN